ncbi:MAG: hypothetical protein M3O46_19895 [Myxococcota bacterium]|nr:hypothetical protein [Myxococcota bacterium]
MTVNVPLTLGQALLFVESESVPIAHLLALAGAAISKVQQRQGAAIDGVVVLAEGAADVAEELKLKGK